ncbi:MAG: hypothetical protein QOE03_3021, partial [Micromonosporaceae bacterium]|nr:hypothetical protein [Micromonosporaceae bacterium]
MTALDEVLVECRSASAWALADWTLVDCLDRVQALTDAVAAVRLSLIREVDGRGVAVGQGATSTAVWLRERYRISSGAAARSVRLAAAMDAEAATVGQALTAGTVNVEQATVIAAAVADLPVELRTAGAQHLVAEAAVFGPRELGVLGQRLLEVVDPGRAQERAGADLARAEDRAYHGRGLFLTDVAGSPRVRVTGWLDREGAAEVRAALDPLCSPRTSRRDGPHPSEPGLGGAATSGDETRSAGSGPAGPDLRTAGQRRADALIEVCRHACAAGELPDNGGDRPQIVVTVNWGTLRGQVGAAMLDDGSPVSAAAARRIACDAAVLPAVLGGAGQVLDIGRERRLFTGPLRRALILRDGGCAHPGCDRPPRWCDGHHIQHWADGGLTALGNAVLLCRHHHRLIHHSDWQVR